MANIITDLTDGVRALQKLSKDISDIAFQEQIVELRMLLVAAQGEILDCQKEIAEKARQIENLESHLAFSKALIEVEGFKYDQDADNEAVGMPYCPRCEKKDRLFIKIIKHGARYFDTKCPGCGVEYGHSAKFRGQGGYD